MISALLGLLLLLPAPVQPIEDDNALLGALKRVILSSSPAGLLKNLTRITFYRSVPPRTRVLEFTAGPLDADELDQKERMQQQQHSPIFSSFPTSKQAGPALSSPCVQPQQVGNGPYRIPRWFFNPGHAKCELFYWSGCCGNANNFGSREVCQRTCEVGTSSSNLNSPTAAAGPNTLIYLPVSMTFASSAPSAASSSPLRPAESAVATSEVSATGDRLLRPPQFPVSNNRQINDNASNGGGPADWVSLEAEEQLDRVATSRSSNQHQRQVQPAAAVSSSGAATNGVVSNWRFSSLETPVANPCAFGTSGQFVLCQPAAASACGGQQFCHVGESPVTTVCCNKPAAIDVCHQPVSPGVGQSALQRWYFYSPAGQCQTFKYRGLQGNENNFQSRMDCEQLCQANPCALGNPMRDFRGQIGYCSAQQPNICPAGFYCHVGGDPRTSLCCPSMAGDPCAQPMNPGQGFYQLQRFFWDAAARCCRPFVYRGQKGNQNNFLSADDCNRVCYVPPNPCRLPIEQPLQPCQPGPEACDGRSDLYCHIGAGPETTVCCPAEPDRCQQPIEPGDGDAQLPRFGYDPQSQQCRQFAYGGLKGNPNNFQTQEECEQACLPNPCASGTPFVGADGRIQGCAVSTSMSTCPNGHWCHVGVNSATTVCCPDVNPNPCQLPMSTGEGFARLERFYYDPASKSCKSFTYKGLKGNQNNFLTLRACQLACLPLDNPCIGQPAKTPSGQVLFCSATNRDTCPVNFWCHLGAIPETTVCCPGATNPCSVPLAPGTGNAGLARWYYNADERQCVSFQYNGKRGNQNNFLSQDECQIACPSLLCLLSIDRGSCSGRQTRYAFSREKGECVPFEYTGCGGNLNNFLSLQECQQICGNVRF